MVSFGAWKVASFQGEMMSAGTSKKSAHSNYTRHTETCLALNHYREVDSNVKVTLKLMEKKVKREDFTAYSASTSTHF